MEINICLHCGGDAEVLEDQRSVQIKCKACGIQTLKYGAALDYSAKNKAISIWNAAADKWPEWVQPTGAHDSYSKGSRVSHKKKHWTSTIDGNVWEPGVSGWVEV